MMANTFGCLASRVFDISARMRYAHLIEFSKSAKGSSSGCSFYLIVLVAIYVFSQHLSFSK